jgi:hypothetical protein
MAMLPIAPFALIGGAIYVLYAVNACITEVRQDGIQSKHAISDHRDELFNNGRGCIRERVRQQRFERR